MTFLQIVKTIFTELKAAAFLRANPGTSHDNPSDTSIVINFVTSKDVRMMRDIEKFYSVPIEEMAMNVADLI
jgi:hypothetical protein